MKNRAFTFLSLDIFFAGYLFRSFFAFLIRRKIMKLPAARNKNLVTRELEEEILIYDLIIDRAYCLNSTSAIVYHACSKGMTFAELKNEHRKLNDEVIHYALRELNKADLIEGEIIDVFKNLSRREVIRKVGMSSLAALPLVASLVAPTAAQAQSTSCPQGSPNPNGAPSGAPAGNITTTGECQTAAGAASASASCNNFYGNRCCSNSAELDSCNVGAYTCKCV